MKRTVKEIVSYIIWLLLASILAIFIVAGLKSEKQNQRPTYIDTTKVQVLYEDTWGKILIIKEE